MENKIDELLKLGALYELIGKCKEIVQLEGLVGGHRGDVDESLRHAQNEVYEALEKLKASIEI